MILPTTLLLGALGYLFYTSKKELSLDHHELIENEKENDDLYKDCLLYTSDAADD